MPISAFSYVVNLKLQVGHSLLLRIELPSLFFLESITLVSTLLQNGHTIYSIIIVISKYCIKYLKE